MINLKIKRPVSIKRPALVFNQMSLLNVRYNLKKYFLNPLTSGTYNRDFRVPYIQVLSTKAVWLALNVQDNWIFHLIMMAEMVEFIVKIVMGTNLDIKEGQGKIHNLDVNH